MKENLKQYINRYVQLSNAEFEDFYRVLEIQEFSKKKLLLEEGKVCRYRYFITEGLIRTFYYDANGNERIIQFGIENWWFTDLDSFINEQASWVNIQALEKTTALTITKNKLEEMYMQIPKIERLFRIITEKSLIAEHRKSNFYMKVNSKERYFHLVKTIPNFVQRVPQYMIASYLDITPEYLSELRKSH